MIIVGEEDALFLTGIFLFDVVKNFLQRCCGFLIGESKIPNDTFLIFLLFFSSVRNKHLHHAYGNSVYPAAPAVPAGFSG